MTRTKKLFINSSNRVSGNPSQFKIIFPDAIFTAKENEIIYLKLNDFVTNFSFYTIEYYNNQFQVNEKDSIGNTYSQIITITPGNYDINSLSTYILGFLNNSPLYTYTMTNNLIYNLWTFTAVIKVAGHRGTIDFDFTQPEFLESAGNAMGFQNGSINSFFPTVADTLVLISTTIVNLNSEENLFLRVDSLFYDNIEYSHISKTFGPSNILGKIPILTPPFSKVNFIDIYENYEVKIDRKNITELNFSITNSYGTIIDLNNHNFNFSIDVIFREIETESDKLLRRIDNLTSIIEQLFNLVRSDILIRHKIKPESE